MRRESDHRREDADARGQKGLGPGHARLPDASSVRCHCIESVAKPASGMQWRIVEGSITMPINAKTASAGVQFNGFSLFQLIKSD
jgi:hypothetical protein